MPLSGPFDHIAEVPPVSGLSGPLDHFADSNPSRSLSGPLDATAEGIPGRSLSGPFDHDADVLSTSLSGPMDHVADDLTPPGPPGTGIVSVSSSPLAGVEAGIARFLPTEFMVRRAYEGPQIIIEWDEPLSTIDVTAIRLVRRRFGYPQHESDGDVIFDGLPADTILSDRDVAECICYFYKLFVFLTDGSILVSIDLQDDVIALSTGYFRQKLWDLLPNLYVISDKPLNEAFDPRLALLEGTNGITPEVFNLGMDGSEQFGPVRRLINLWGPMLDEAKGLIDCFPNQLDVDDSCIPELEGLAALLGLPLNKELSPQGMRNEVRNQSEFLKQKGTIPGLIARFRSVSGLTPVIREQCNRLLISNDPTRTSPLVVPSEGANLGTADDELFYSVGYYEDIQPFWLWFSVFVTLEGGLNEPTGRKWCLAVEEASPACHKGFLNLLDSNEDTIEIGQLDEALPDDFFTEDDDAMPVVFAEVATDEIIPDVSKFLITSDVTKLTSADNWESVTASPTLP
jgi:hypothetical protein